MIVYLFFLLISLTWLGILFGVAIAENTGMFNATLLKNIDTLFGLICHQDALKSFYINGGQLPVCIRCFGIYSGLVLGCIIYPLFRNINDSQSSSIKYLMLFIIPLFLDIFLRILNVYQNLHFIRLFTGILFSVGLVFYSLPVLNNVYQQYKFTDNNSN